jgi:hypothetical protein
MSILLLLPLKLQLTDSPVTGYEILDAISELLPKKSEDFNGVSMFFIKQFKHYFFNPLQHIVNRSLVTGFVPHQFKIAKVIPLFKSGDKFLPDNFCCFLIHVLLYGICLEACG